MKYFLVVLSILFLITSGQAKDIKFIGTEILIFNETIPEEQNVFVTFADSAIVISGRKQSKEVRKRTASQMGSGPRYKLKVDTIIPYQDTTVVPYNRILDLAYERSPQSP